MPPEEQTEAQNFDEVAASLILKPTEKGNENADSSEGKEVKSESVAKSETTSQEGPKESERESVDNETEGEGQQLEDPVDEEDIDVDAIELELTVDGVTKRVPIGELKKKYSHEGAVEKRLEEVTKGREIVGRQSQELNIILGHQAQRLEALDNVLKEAQKPNINWEELRIKDPTKYLFEREAQRELQERRSRIQQEHQRITAQQRELEQAALIEYGQNEYRALAKADPDFADPVKAPLARKSLYDGAKRYGYTDQEVDSVLDHRAVLVLRDANRYHELMAKQKRVSIEARSEPRVLLKPGVKKASTKTTEQKQLRALRDKARASGKADDVAATLLMRTPAR